MALKYWWLVPLGLAVLATVVVVLWRRPRPSQDLVPVAHADRLTALPAYKKAVARHRRWLVTALAALAVLAVSLIVAAARPVSESTSIPEQRNRDIMLCLDVSGSMLDTDEAIVSVFADLVGKFKGERIGLTIFDSSAVMAFPLTDDYDFVAEELKLAKKALSADATSFGYLAGTYEAAGSSLIGDGLASCVNGFPATTDTKRSRSIIFATDNMLSGKPIFTLAQSTTLAKSANTRIYALNPNDYGSIPAFASAAKGLQDTARATGGAYYPLESQAAVESIVNKVQATEASLLKGAPHRLIVDHPGLAMGVALLALLVFGAAGWRLRR
ncbi:VWA domain-containing protein [Arthrobacter sp. TMN-49]